MLKDYLRGSIKDIQQLIDITQLDIKDIKSAMQDSMFERIKEKNNILISFTAKKALLDNELVLLSKAHEGEDLSQILSPEDSRLLENMREKLEELQVLNSRYAKMVVGVSEFYHSVLDSMFPADIVGYEKPTNKPATFLKLKV